MDNWKYIVFKTLLGIHYTSKSIVSVGFWIRYKKRRIQNIEKESLIIWQDCSYQGRALNLPIAFQVLLSSNNIKKLSVINENEFFLS